MGLLEPQAAATAGELFNTLKHMGAIGTWRLPSLDAQGAIDTDQELALNLAEQGNAGAILRIWRNHHALVVPQSFRSKPGFDQAMGGLPIPLALRKSGGTAVVHGPHILNISRISCATRNQPINIPRAYDQLGKIILTSLAEIGIEAAMGDVRGSHCPGQYSITVAGKKLAGTAAFISDMGHCRMIIAHACLSLAWRGGDLALIQSFERKLGMPGDYSPDAHICLNSSLATFSNSISSCDYSKVNIAAAG